MRVPESKPDNTSEKAAGNPRVDPSGFSNPWVQITLSVVLSAAAQVLLKLGVNGGDGMLGLSVLHSGWGWLGIVVMIASLGSWLHALQAIPLNIAFNLAGAIHVLVPLSSWIILGERIGFTRWCGIVLIATGVIVVARPLMRLEERL